VEREDAEFRGANERTEAMAEDLRKAEPRRSWFATGWRGWTGSWAPTRKATTCGRALRNCTPSGRSKVSRKTSGFRGRGRLAAYAVRRRDRRRIPRRVRRPESCLAASRMPSAVTPLALNMAAIVPSARSNRSVSGSEASRA
jgi:hypothetical protein